MILTVFILFSKYQNKTRRIILRLEHFIRDVEENKEILLYQFNIQLFVSRYIYLSILWRTIVRTIVKTQLKTQVKTPIAPPVLAREEPGRQEIKCENQMEFQQ